MANSHLANVPENWVYNIYREFSLSDLEKILKALPLKVVKRNKFYILVKPDEGHEKALRIVLGRLFRRAKGIEARTFILKQAAQQ